MNFFKKLKKLFKSKKPKDVHCANCYNSIDFFENPTKVAKDENPTKTKSIHVHHYTPWLTITETLTDDEEDKSSLKQKKSEILKSTSESNMKIYHHKHYDSKKRKRQVNNKQQCRNFGRFSNYDEQETYDNYKPMRNNVSFVYLKKAPFINLFYPGIFRQY